VLFGLVVMLILSGSVIVLDRTGKGGAEQALSTPAAASDADAPAALLEETTSTTGPALGPAPAVAAAPRPRTQPTPPPNNERAASPIVQIGEIRIPKIGLVHPIFEGVTLTVIDHGPGHWPGSAMPGQLGNAVFAGHRVTHTHPFRNVDQLTPGDEITLTTASGTFIYRMTKQEIVSPSDTWIVTPTPNATLTLFGCHPPGSARQRIVIRAELVSAAPAHA